MAVIGEAAIRIVPETKGFGSGLTKALKAGLAGGVLAVGEFARESVKAFSTAQQSEEALNFAFEKFPKLADVSQKSLLGVATTISETTKFSRAQVIAGESMVAQFGLTGKQVEKVTPLIADFAARTGRDLPAAAQLVGRAFLGNTRALKGLGINYKSTKDQAKDTANVIKLLNDRVGGFAKNQGKTAAGTAEILKHQFEEIQVTVGRALVPVLLGLVTAFKPLLPVIGDLVVSLATALAPVIKTLAVGLSTLVPVITPVVKILGGVLLHVFKALAPVLLAVANALVASLGPILTALSPALVQLAELLGQTLLALVPLLPALLQLLPPLIQLAVVIAVPLLKALTQILPPLVTLAVRGLTPLIGIITKLVDLLSRVLAPVFRVVGSILVGVFHGAIRIVTRAFSTFFDLVFRVVEIVSRFGDLITRAGGRALEFFTGLPGRVLRAVAGFGSLLFSAGKNVVQGLINGIKSIGHRVLEALLNLIPGPLRKFAHLLGIHSPSTVFEEFGRNIVQGLIVGIQRQGPGVDRALTELARRASSRRFGSPALAVGTGGTPAAGAAGVGTGATVNVFTQSTDARVITNLIIRRLADEAAR